MAHPGRRAPLAGRLARAGRLVISLSATATRLLRPPFSAKFSIFDRFDTAIYRYGTGMAKWDTVPVPVWGRNTPQPVQVSCFSYRFQTLISTRATLMLCEPLVVQKTGLRRRDS